MIRTPKIILEFEQHAGFYLPGDEIAGLFYIELYDPKKDESEVNAIEASVLWYTMGKGDEDLAVHYFDRHTRIEGHAFDVSVPRRFGTVLPNSPLSYDGQIVKIIWCVRVRVFLRGGREHVSEQPFRLGAAHLPPVVSQFAAK
ncbi:MAG: hypothetical protein KDA42_04735 [Planctomycetales bacterium]|nr:hypothetical protein [Planctomycetales bacterium]